MNKVLIFFLSVVSYSMQANFIKSSLLEYKAHKAYESSDFLKANQDWTELLQQNPYDASLNYNIGLALYQQKKYEDAPSYFNRAITYAQDLLLKEQALFNLGNTCVQLKKLQEAIDSYEQVLRMNPDNARAKNNLEYVRQLQKQQEQSKDQDQQDQQQDNDQENSENKEDKQNSEKQKKDSKDQKDQDSENDKKDQQNKKEKKSKKDQAKDSSENRSDSDDEKSQEEQKQDKKSEKQKNRDKDEKSDKKEEQAAKNAKDKNEEEQQQEDVSKDLKKSEKNKKNDAKSQALEQDGAKDKNQETELADAYATEMNQKPQDDQRLDKRASMILQKMHEQEKQVQKELLKLNAAKQGSSNHGQKNW